MYLSCCTSLRPTPFSYLGGREELVHVWGEGCARPESLLGQAWMGWFKLFHIFFPWSSCQNCWWDILISTWCHLPVKQLSGQSCPRREQFWGQRYSCTHLSWAAHMWHREKVRGAEGPAGCSSVLMLLRGKCGREVWVCMPPSTELCCFFFLPRQLYIQWISESQDASPADQITCPVLEQASVQVWNGELTVCSADSSAIFANSITSSQSKKGENVATSKRKYRDILYDSFQ